MFPETHTHLFQTHRCTWHINKHKHSGSLCACCLSKPVVYVQTVQHSVWFLLLANVCLCSLCCSLCVLHFRLSLPVSLVKQTDRFHQYWKIFTLLHTDTLKATPPSLGFPTSPHLRPRPLVPPGKLSLCTLHTGLVSFWDNSWNFGLFGFIFFH